MRGCLFVFWLTVDRHGLSALAITRVRKDRDDKSGMGRVLFVIARRERSERRGNPSCLGGCGRSCLFVYCGPVDRHGHRPRDDKSDGFPFTLHTSIFTLPSFAFLETDTEAKGAAAVALS